MHAKNSHHCKNEHTILVVYIFQLLTLSAAEYWKLVALSIRLINHYQATLWVLYFQNGNWYRLTKQNIVTHHIVAWISWKRNSCLPGRIAYTTVNALFNIIMSQVLFWLGVPMPPSVIDAKSLAYHWYETMRARFQTRWK